MEHRLTTRQVALRKLAAAVVIVIRGQLEDHAATSERGVAAGTIAARRCSAVGASRFVYDQARHGDSTVTATNSAAGQYFD